MRVEGRCPQGQGGGPQGEQKPEGARPGWMSGSGGVYPGVKTHSSRTAVEWTPVCKVGTARRPVHHLCFVDTLSLQKGVTKEADVL